MKKHTPFFLKIVSLCVTMLSAVQLHAQQPNYYFRHLKVEDGLSQNTVWCVLQDSKNFIWFGTKDGLNRYDGDKFKQFRHEIDSDTGLGNNFIRSLYEDRDQRIWIGTSNGVYIYNPIDESLGECDAITAQGISLREEVNDIKQDQDGNMWIVVNRRGLFKLDNASNELVRYEFFDKNQQNLLSGAWTMVFDSKNPNKLWIGTHGAQIVEMDIKIGSFKAHKIGGPRDEIYKVIDTGSEILAGTSRSGLISFNKQNYSTRNLYSNSFVRDIKLLDNKIWLATESGLVIYDPFDNSDRVLKYNKLDPFSISSNAVYCIYEDRQNTLWIGTYFGGVNYLPKQNKHFDKYYHTDKNNFIADAVREFREDENGVIWIGTEDAGLYKFFPKDGTFEQVKNVSYHNVHGICIDNDKIYVGTFTSGLEVVDMNSGKVVDRYVAGNDKNGLTDNNVFAINKADNGDIWIGTIYGLNILNPKTRTIRKVEQIGLKTFVYDILKDKDGVIWIATYNDGLYSYNYNNNNWNHYLQQEQHQNTLCYNRILTVFQDSKEYLWLGSEGGGVSRFDIKKNEFKNFDTRNGLPNNVVYKVLEDNYGHLWFSTNNGLAMMDRESEKFSVYNVSDGLLVDQFNYKSGIKASDGRLYFGTIAGFIGFDPLSFSKSIDDRKVVITNMLLFNEELPIGVDGSPLTKSILYTDKVELKHWQSTLSFDFTSFDYDASNTTYSYRMTHYDKDWIELPSNQRITYSRLPPGEYQLEIRASNSNGEFSDNVTTLNITILHPIWETTIAYILYFIIILTILYLVYSHFDKRIKARNLQRIQAVRYANEQNLYRAKLEFFTTIAHDIRTPLTLIKAPFESIVSQELSEEQYCQNRDIIQININRLSTLVNQLLDFRKIDSGGLSIYRSNSNVVDVLHSVVGQFNALIIAQQTQFSLNLPNHEVIAFIDREAMLKIVSNLISNAFKFAKSRVTVSLEVVDEKFIIVVENDGALIPKDSHESIFMPFVQVKSATTGQGTGLGLPIVKHLVELHQGEVHIDGTSDVNRFVVCIPLVVREMNERELEVLESEECKHNKEDNAPKVLVVDDDALLRKYMNDVISKTYNVYSASNGEEAIKILQSSVVDLVVTDLMMPQMNGAELCQHLKSTDEYSHIPIIMLSAKGDAEHKVAGLESGADVYIEKPFSSDQLLLQIGNLIASKNKIIESFLRNPTLTSQTLTTNKADQRFLNKVTQIIYDNLSDEQFSVDMMAEQMHLSRSSLHRKIKGVVNMTPNDFIRITRLKKAAEYLLEDSSSIGEISYIVGFKSPSYFTKCFKEQFGVLPKEYCSKR